MIPPIPSPRVAVQLALPVGLALLAVGCQPPSDTPREAMAEMPPHVMASSPIETGRYLVRVGGCNDCHTDGWMETNGDVPEESRLTGSAVGFRGPWGTTYPANLRLTVQNLTEDEFVDMLQTRKALPPMPWMNINGISDPDARAIYQYIRSLGSAGELANMPVPPEEEPTTPYILLVPVPPAGG